MIYFSNETVKFPRHFAEISTKLVLVNELSSETIELDFVDTSDSDRYYAIDLSNLTISNGTYKYRIGKEVGLLQVGDYTAPSTQYDERKSNVVYER